MDYKDIISKNIKKYRKLSGLSQVELAKKLGITSASISNWEKGQNSIDTEMLFKVCNILNVSMDAMGSIDSSTTLKVSYSSDRQKELNRIYESLDNDSQNELLKYGRYLELETDSNQSDRYGSGDISNIEKSSGGIA